MFAAAAGSGAAIVSPGPLPNVVLIAIERPAVMEALYRAGAWSLVNAQGWAGCVASDQSGAEP